VWLDRVGGAAVVAEGLADLDTIPTPDVDGTYYVDFDETGPFEVNVAESECAT
jgi:hypothetical protein